MIAERLATIQQHIAEACQRSNRQADTVTLVGAAKRQPLEKVLAAREAGLRVIGENRVQEAEWKQPQVTGVEWHLIGPLQSNKAKKAARLFSAVHSIDRPKIARVLAREAASLDRELTGFLEVNVGREASKHGFDPDALLEAARPLAELDGLRIVGLMAIPPFEREPEAARVWFRKLRELRDALCATTEFASCPGWLSMGMSGDFEVAIEEGATHVRVGTSLFGPRPAL
jgi:pyridoxal phosphate enzyme (YggS family)